MAQGPTPATPAATPSPGTAGPALGRAGDVPRLTTPSSAATAATGPTAAPADHEDRDRVHSLGQGPRVLRLGEHHVPVLHGTRLRRRTRQRHHHRPQDRRTRADHPARVPTAHPPTLPKPFIMRPSSRPGAAFPRARRTARHITPTAPRPPQHGKRSQRARSRPGTDRPAGKRGLPSTTGVCLKDGSSKIFVGVDRFCDPPWWGADPCQADGVCRHHRGTAAAPVRITGREGGDQTGGAADHRIDQG
ncbi:hypothetical protein SSCG_02201 [Streptomyces clavuligerus]|nr:hypothetical protein SSCG_02201 [Streptomyces clavuligerus]